MELNKGFYSNIAGVISAKTGSTLAAQEAVQRPAIQRALLIIVTQMKNKHILIFLLCPVILSVFVERFLSEKENFSVFGVVEQYFYCLFPISSTDSDKTLSG